MATTERGRAVAGCPFGRTPAGTSTRAGSPSNGRYQESKCRVTSAALGCGRVSGYFVLQIEWKSADARGTYVEQLGKMIEKHGGEFIIASGDYRVVEGNWRGGRLIVVKFPSVQALSAWYDSEEYRSARDFRLNNARCDAVVVEGV